MIDFQEYLPGTIIDAVHGAIDFTEIERWVIDQKPYARLRGVKQNTFLYYVFPSANHSRFEHSIGVMHLASEVFRNCQKNYLSASNKAERRNEQVGSLVNLESLLGTEKVRIWQELRLAALLHDVGHGPLSHAFDKFSLTGSQLLSLLASDSTLAAYSEHFQKALGDNLSHRVEHEIVSCVFILKLIQDLKTSATDNAGQFSENTRKLISQIRGEDIVSLINQDFEFPSIIVNDLDLTPFLRGIITGAPIDADRMDYLMRDSLFAGVKYGVYDMARIFMSFVAVRDQKGAKILLGVKSSGLASIIGFIESRAPLFTEVYNHKTNSAAAAMLEYACLDIQKSVVDSRSYEELEEFYWEHSDEYFLRRRLPEEVKGTGKKAKVLMDLRSRRLWKRISVDRRILSTKQSKEIGPRVKELINVINNKLTSLDYGAYMTKTDIAPFKDIEKSMTVIVEKVLGEYDVALQKWPEYSDELRRLEYEVHILRVFLEKDMLSADDFRERRKALMHEIKSQLEEIQDLYGNVTAE